MKEPSSILGQVDLTSRKMREVVIYTVEKFSTREATERMVNIIFSTYVNEELERVAANATQLDDKERTQLLGILKDFEDLFDGTLG